MDKDKTIVGPNDQLDDQVKGEQPTVDDIGLNLEQQLENLVASDQVEVNMDSKINSAIEKIVQETVGDIPEPTITTSAQTAVSADTKKEQKRQKKLAEKAQRQQDKLDRKAEKQAEKQYRREMNDLQSEEQVKRKKRTGMVIGILSGVILLGLLGTYGGFAYHYRNIFFEGTTINGIDCTELTVDQAEQIIRQGVEDYSITIDFRDGTAETITGEQIDYKYVSDGGVERIKESQHPLAWIMGYIQPTSYEVGENIQYDQQKLTDAFHGLVGIQNDTQIAPTDAYVSYVGNTFAIVPETQGNQLDREEMLVKLEEAVSGSQTEINLEELGLYNGPQILSDNADLAAECQRLNELASASITYTLPSGTRVLDGNVIRTWLTANESGQYVLTDENLQAHVQAFVAEIAEETDNIGSSRPFHATLQGDITVSGGTYGWKVNQSAEVAQLVQEIKDHTVTTREPNYSSREVTTDNNGFGSTYIEVDLTNQHLWYYIDGSLYLDSPFVSGTYTVAERRTPPGLFTLTYKQRDRVLRGREIAPGQYEYESPVSYWMPFNGGIGFHDATWRGSFGGIIYRYSGSHGCINMPSSKAASMYEVIDKQTPIICFY